MFYGVHVPPAMGSLTAALLIAVFVVLHQDVWFWSTARPLVFGFLPIGLFYHAAFTVACAGLMGLFVARRWPGHLESDVDRRPAHRK
jgi:hypothetical protein